MEELRDSYLLADIGHVTSRAALLDRVADEYRFIARGEALSTLEPPWEDVALGLREAVGEIQRIAQRPLLDQRGSLRIPEDDDGQGVDGFLVTTSAMQPLRVALLGLMGSWSLTRAQRVVHSTYATVERVLDVERWRLGGGEELAWLAQALSSDRLDAILLVGGTEGGAVTPMVEMAKDLGLLLQAYPGEREPRVIYAGNSAARLLVAQALGKVADLRVVENVLPSFEAENYLAAREALDQLVLEAQLPTLPGIRALAEAWGLAPVYPAAQALGWSISYLARQYGLDILGVDVGAASITLVSARGEEPPRIVTHVDGLGQGLEGFLARLGMERVRRWLPEELPMEEVERLALSKALHLRMLPQEREDLSIQRSLARELILSALQTAQSSDDPSAFVPFPQVDLVVGAGGPFTTTPHYRQAALILLDALQPSGVFSLALDRLGLLPQLGALAAQHPLAAAQALARDGLLHLGTVIAPLGRAREGSLALRFRVTYADRSSLEGEVTYGSIEVVPLPPGQRATVELHPTPAFDVGVGRSGKGAATEVEGGPMGLLFDARGRPLSLPEREEERRAKIRGWIREAGF